MKGVSGGPFLQLKKKLKIMRKKGKTRIGGEQVTKSPREGDVGLCLHPRQEKGRQPGRRGVETHEGAKYKNKKAQGGGGDLGEVQARVEKKRMPNNNIAQGGQ